MDAGCPPAGGTEPCQPGHTCLVLLDLHGDSVQDEAGGRGGAEELLCVCHPAQQLLHGAVELGGDGQPLGQALLQAQRGC